MPRVYINRTVGKGRLNGKLSLAMQWWGIQAEI